MLDRIKSLLAQSGFKREAATQRFSEKDIAVAVLLLEAAATDGDYGEAEHQVLGGLVSRKLQYAPADATAMIDVARERQQQAVELHAFTNAVRREMDEGERGALVEMLWEVVYADGVLDAYEDRLIRSVAALLHVPDRVRAEARQRVLGRQSNGT
jgi:uncharacterized tellurite resistance protein B-like protein